ncbi:hypothetical protein F2Q68_00032027 [Brassica cretica]|uniref:Uncharacterized protein n=1 Tax=Brassica cretica TaxID=69181 RepID=A0A8S9G3B0_BRACR|nr:hypothetical protein F2Q68_00032027 [Brassica cretica]
MIPSKPVIFSYNQVEVPSKVSSDPRISLSRPVSVFMMKPRLCPSRDQSSPVKMFILGFGHVLSDQPAASRLEHCELACVNSTSNLGFPLSLKIVSQQEAELSGVSSTSYPAGLRKPLIRWIESTQRDRVMAYGREDIAEDDEEEHKVTISRVLTLSPKSGLGTRLGLVFPLLEARSWQEAKSNLLTVALGKDDRIAWCWTLGPPE